MWHAWNLREVGSLLPFAVHTLLEQLTLEENGWKMVDSPQVFSALSIIKLFIFTFSATNFAVFVHWVIWWCLRKEKWKEYSYHTSDGILHICLPKIKCVCIKNVRCEAALRCCPLFYNLSLVIRTWLPIPMFLLRREEILHMPPTSQLCRLCHLLNRRGQEVAWYWHVVYSKVICCVVVAVLKTASILQLEFKIS